MQTLLPLAQAVAVKLIARRQTLAIAESSAGGLLSAALLSVPGASAYFLGGAVVYTRQAREALLGLSAADLDGIRPSTEAYTALLAGRPRAPLGADLALAQHGATGPTRNRNGDAAGHACIALAGPTERTTTIETASAAREENMRAFAGAALRLLAEALQ